MNVEIEGIWKKALHSEFEKPYFKSLTEFVRKEYANAQVFPPGPKIFQAMDRTSMDAVKVVILGQDPYHGAGQAHGLCFSVNDGIRQPPSLKNIFKEIERDLGIPVPQSGNLERWADQGVLLLNATLTVRAGQPASHQGQGWEQFTGEVIRAVSEYCENVVFLLWGASAQRKESLIDSSKHLVLKAVHPSPLSAYRGFIGCGHFSKVNDYLREKGKEEIAW